GDEGGRIYLWDAHTGQPAGTLPSPSGSPETAPAGELTHPSGAVSGLAFSPDGSQLAAAARDQTVRLWDVAARAPLAVLSRHPAPVCRRAYSADGRLLAAAADRAVYLWDVRARERVAVLPHASVVYGLAFSPDGTRLAAGCRDKAVRLWDVATGEEV